MFLPFSLMIDSVFGALMLIVALDEKSMVRLIMELISFVALATQHYILFLCQDVKWCYWILINRERSVSELRLVGNVSFA